MRILLSPGLWFCRSVHVWDTSVLFPLVVAYCSVSCSLRMFSGISPVMMRSELSEVPAVVPVAILSALYWIELSFCSSGGVRGWKA